MENIEWLVHIIKVDIETAIRYIKLDNEYRTRNPDSHYHTTIDKIKECRIPGCSGVDPRTYLLNELEDLLDKAHAETLFGVSPIHANIEYIGWKKNEEEGMNIEKIL